MNKNTKLRLELYLATLLTIFGCLLLMLGFWVEKKGEIDTSVLIAFGEIITFAGSLLGIDYHKNKIIENIRDEIKSK